MQIYFILSHSVNLIQRGIKKKKKEINQFSVIALRFPFFRKIKQNHVNQFSFESPCICLSANCPASVHSVLSLIAYFLFIYLPSSSPHLFFSLEPRSQCRLLEMNHSRALENEAPPTSSVLAEDEDASECFCINRTALLCFCQNPNTRLRSVEQTLESYKSIRRKRKKIKINKNVPRIGITAS